MKNIDYIEGRNCKITNNIAQLVELVFPDYDVLNVTNYLNFIMR